MFSLNLPVVKIVKPANSAAIVNITRLKVVPNQNKPVNQLLGLLRFSFRQTALSFKRKSKLITKKMGPVIPPGK